ncbi:MAG: hypothetical protein CVU87_01150 [Firmicutes bacterium HGW-Firmicutes-12]|nr:MAG: hypothetical protein CVU87_01150 [Firmicutes bacterium HGW-Firmicutes-12]
MGILEITARKIIKTKPDNKCILSELQLHTNLNLRFLWMKYKTHQSGGLKTGNSERVTIVGKIAPARM